MRYLILLRVAALLAVAAGDGCMPSGPAAPRMDSSAPGRTAEQQHTQSAPGAQPYEPPSKPELLEQELTTEELFVAYCSACHSLELVESQRLDRANWEWVMSDMVGEYGGAWITEQEQKILVDYLVDNYGPRPR